jgi:hypothetical protein
MNFSKKALISVLLVLAFVIVPVVAAVNVTWEWILDDSEVQYFRYQLEGELDDAWTVVPSSVTCYELENADGSVAHTLYLQQSYDGKNWSPSAYASSDPVVTEEEPVVEAAPVAEPEAVEEPAEVVEEPAPAAEEPVAEEPAPAAEEAVAVVETPAVAEKSAPAPKARTNDFDFTLAFDGGAQYRINPPAGATDYSVRFNVGIGLENIIKIGRSAGIGLWTDVFAILDTDKQAAFGDYFKLDNYAKGAGADALLTLNFNGKKNKLILGGGADFRLYDQSSPLSSGSVTIFGKNTYGYDYNVVGMARLSHNFNDVFSLYLAGKYAFSIESKVQEVGGTVGLAFSF